MTVMPSTHNDAHGLAADALFDVLGMLCDCHTLYRANMQGKDLMSDLVSGWVQQLREYFDEFLAPGDNGDDSTSARSEHNQADDSDHVFGDEDSNTKNRK